MNRYRPLGRAADCPAAVPPSRSNFIAKVTVNKLGKSVPNDDLVENMHVRLAQNAIWAFARGFLGVRR